MTARVIVRRGASWRRPVIAAFPLGGAAVLDRRLVFGRGWVILDLAHASTGEIDDLMADLVTVRRELAAAERGVTQ